MAEASAFNKIRISLASPMEMRQWSHGEVKKPETINYRTFKPERDGLFCERIFGPVKDWECHCGRYKKVKFKGVTCDRCGVEITRAKVRRERMGHIELAAPVSHIWYLKGVPSPMSLLLDISPRPLEKVIYFGSYIVTHIDRRRIQEEMEEIRQAVEVEIQQIQEAPQGELTDALLEEQLANYDTVEPAADSDAAEAEEADAEEEGAEATPDAAAVEGAATEDPDLMEDEAAEEPLPEVLAVSEASRIAEAKNLEELIRELTDAVKLLEGLQKRQLIQEDEWRGVERVLEVSGRRLGRSFQGVVRANLGAAAIEEVLTEINLEDLSRELKAEIASTQGPRRGRAVKRLEVTEAFLKSKSRPEWMILQVVTVIPPELRPMVQLDGGRFATSDLNDLYRRIINRNNRLKKITDIRAPESIINHEKRLLQEAVDALIDNGRRSRPVVGSNNRPLRSLSDMLKGKEGRFRKNLLGKRVDYSGRSVIVVGPKLKLHQCGLPKEMALELFKPFVMKTLVAKQYTSSIKTAKRMMERVKSEVWDALEDVIKEHPVLLNRAPTLHRLGIQAFEPILVDGKAIQLHPLVCRAFGADFDGDQMAVHVPLSSTAQAEARLLMLSTRNVFSSSNGNPIVAPKQDIVLGCFYLTQCDPDAKGTGLVFKDAGEAMLAYAAGKVHLLAKVKIGLKAADGIRQFIEAPVGRILLNQLLPDDAGSESVTFGDNLPAVSLDGPGDGNGAALLPLPGDVEPVGPPPVIPPLFVNKSPETFLNKELDDRAVARLITDWYKTHGWDATVRLLDDLKEIGFRYATQSGITIAITDLEVPEQRNKIINDTQTKVDSTNRQYKLGMIASGEREQRVLELWTTAAGDVAKAILDNISNFNPVYMIAKSGARGSTRQISQLSGMRGMMSDPFGKLIEDLPIKSNFHEGLTVLEYFISTHGQRKGLADTALRTADAGYLTRRLVDVAQDVIIRDTDCGAANGIYVREIEDDSDMMEASKEREPIEPLHERIRGRYALEDNFHPRTGEQILWRNTEILDPQAEGVQSAVHSIRDEVEAETAPCDLYNPYTGEKMTEAGQPLDSTAQDVLRRWLDGIGIRSPMTCELRKGICRFCYGRDMGRGRLVEVGTAVGIIAAQSIGEPGTQLTMRTFHTGGVAAQHITGVAGVKRKKQETLKEIHEDARKGLVTLGEAGETRERSKAVQAMLKVLEEQVRGLLRVVELVEARRPKGQAIITEFEGVVAEIEEKRGGLPEVAIHTTVHTTDLEGYAGESLAYAVLSGGVEAEKDPVTGEFTADPKDVILPAGTELTDKVIRAIRDLGMQRVRIRKSYLVPYRGTKKEQQRIVSAGRVRVGQRVRAGDRLTEGPLDPQTVLRLQGLRGVQDYLVREVQLVYRGQSTEINDKHLEVIVRQMLKKRQIRDPGSTGFLPGQIVDRFDLEDENRRVEQLDPPGRTATAEALLLGITEASLATDSFLSAASFQKTTKVLAEAAIRGKEDSLVGLKENVIIGRLIPAGTGLATYRKTEKDEPEDRQREQRRAADRAALSVLLAADLSDDRVDDDPATLFGDDQDMLPRAEDLLNESDEDLSDVDEPEDDDDHLPEPFRTEDD